MNIFDYQSKKDVHNRPNRPQYTQQTRYNPAGAPPPKAEAATPPKPAENSNGNLNGNGKSNGNASGNANGNSAQANNQNGNNLHDAHDQESYEHMRRHHYGMRSGIRIALRSSDTKWLTEAVTTAPTQWVTAEFRRAFKETLRRDTVHELRKLCKLYDTIIELPNMSYLQGSLNDDRQKAGRKIEKLEEWHAKLLEDWQQRKASRRKDYVREQDIRAEKVVDVYRRHKIHILMLSIIPIGLFIFNAILFAFLSVTLRGLTPINLIILVIDLAWFGWTINDWRNDYLMVTNRRILQYEKITFFKEDKKAILIERVEQVSYVSNRGIFEFVFRIGTVTITGAGKLEIVFDKVYLPDRIRKEVMDAKVTYMGTRSKFRSERMENQLRNKMLNESLKNWDEDGMQVDAIPRSELSFWQTLVPSKPVDEGNNQVVFRRHPLFLYKDWAKVFAIYLILLPIGIFALPLLFAVGNAIISTVGFIVFLLVFLWNTVMLWFHWEDWYSDRYILSNRDIIDVEKKPFGLDEEKNTVGLIKVQDIELAQTSIIANFFDYGDVRITTAGAGNPIVFKSVPEPDAVRAEIARRMEIAKNIAEDMNDKLTLDYFGHYNKIFSEKLDAQRALLEAINEQLNGQRRPPQ